METSDLLFAAEVRKLAVIIMDQQIHNYRIDVQSDPDRADKIEKFDKSIQVNDFLETAYNRIVDAAEQLRVFEAARQAKRLDGNKFAQLSQRAPATFSETATPSE